MSFSQSSPVKSNYNYSSNASPNLKKVKRGASLLFEGTPNHNLAAKASTLQGMAGGMVTGGNPSDAAKKNIDHPDVNLESPTSIKMKNSLLIKHADPSFDAINQMKKKKNFFAMQGANIFGVATSPEAS